MIERLIENWLDRANERSFQVPFSQLLAHQEYTVLHITRHCGMEMGKDIIALTPEGTPCAYQLKEAGGRRIRKSEWQNMLGQINELVNTSIVHPALHSQEPHQSYLVTNGGLDEEVQRGIDDFNNQQRQMNKPILEVIIGGKLKNWAIDLGMSMWPIELPDMKLTIELLNEEGENNVNKTKVAALMERTLPIEVNKGSKPSKKECSRSISAAGLLTAMVLQNYSLKDNHVAQIEGWTLYCAYVLCLAERWTLPLKYWQKEFETEWMLILNCFENLKEELFEKKHIVEGNVLFEEQLIYKTRVTWLASLMGIYGLWRQRGKIVEDESSKFIEEFCKKHLRLLFL